MSKKLEIVNQICDQIDDIYYQYANTFGVTDTELCILHSLYEHDGEYMQSDICHEWHCSLQTVHTAIKNMEKKKLIELSCQTGNRKNKYIHLCPAGKALITSILMPLLQAEENAFSMLTEEEQDRLVPLLQKYAAALEMKIRGIMRPSEGASV